MEMNVDMEWILLDWTSDISRVGHFFYSSNKSYS